MEDNTYREALAEHVQRVVDAFPELPAEQRDKLTALLRAPTTLLRDYHTQRPYVLDQLTAFDRRCAHRRPATRPALGTDRPPRAPS